MTFDEIVAAKLLKSAEASYERVVTEAIGADCDLLLADATHYITMAREAARAGRDLDICRNKDRISSIYWQILAHKDGFRQLKSGRWIATGRLRQATRLT